MIEKHDWKISVLNIGTNYSAKMPVNPRGGAGQISTGIWAETAAHLRASFRGINRPGGGSFYRYLSAQTL